MINEITLIKIIRCAIVHSLNTYNVAELKWKLYE